MGLHVHWSTLLVAHQLQLYFLLLVWCSVRGVGSSRKEMMSRAVAWDALLSAVCPTRVCTCRDRLLLEAT